MFSRLFNYFAGNETPSHENGATTTSITTVNIMTLSLAIITIMAFSLVINIITTNNKTSFGFTKNNALTRTVPLQPA
jgi:hypothetical protein